MSTVDPLTVHGDELADVCAALGISYAGAWCIRQAQSLICTYSWDPARLGYVLSRVDLDDLFIPEDFAETSPPPGGEVARPAPAPARRESPVEAPKRRAPAAPAPAQNDLFARLGGSR